MMRPLAPFAAVSRCRRALGRDALVVLEQLRRGECGAFECDQGVSIIRNDFPDLVIVAYEGAGGIEAFDYWREVAKQKGFHFVRFHSSRPGAMRYAKSIGAEVEFIFIREV